MTGTTERSEKEVQAKARRNITYLLMFAIVMFFAGLVSAYVVSMGSSGYWTNLRMPKAFYFSTAVVLAATGSIQMALVSARKGKLSAVPLWLSVTLLFGISFCFTQMSGYSELVGRGNHVTGPVVANKGVYGVDYSFSRKGVQLLLVDGKYYEPEDTGHTNPLNAELEEAWNGASAYIYVLTGAHLLHLAAGIIALLVMLALAFRRRYTPEDHVGLWAGTVYWHFLTGLWVFLFSFLTFLH